MKTKEQIEKSLSELSQNLMPTFDKVKALVENGSYDQAIEEVAILQANLIGAVIAQDILNDNR